MKDLHQENLANAEETIQANVTDAVQDDHDEKHYTEQEIVQGNALIALVKAGDLEGAKQLAEQGADMCFTEPERGRTLLHYAAEHGHRDMVEWLLTKGGPAYNIVDNHEVTAGELALKNNHDEVYRDLVSQGVRAELILRQMSALQEPDGKAPNEDYLNQKLHYDDNKLLDANNDAVMMGWEGPLMVEHAKVMCPREGLDVLNVGFGLGLIDTEIQKYKPRNHYIIEAHPDVYAHMIALGWDKKPGVTICFGRWQDVLPTLTIPFDGIFFDTYGEFYDDLRAFHDAVPNLLQQDGIYTWFNGLGATNQFFHDIYCEVSEIDLCDFGLNTEYVTMEIGTADERGVWDGVRQRYWVLDTYKLPICKFLE